MPHIELHPESWSLSHHVAALTTVRGASIEEIIASAVQAIPAIVRETRPFTPIDISLHLIEDLGGDTNSVSLDSHNLELHVQSIKAYRLSGHCTRRTRERQAIKALKTEISK